MSAVTSPTVIPGSLSSRPIHSIAGGPETPIVRVTVQVRVNVPPATTVAGGGVIATVGGATKKKKVIVRVNNCASQTTH